MIAIYLKTIEKFMNHVKDKARRRHGRKAVPPASPRISIRRNDRLRNFRLSCGHGRVLWCGPPEKQAGNWRLK